MALLFLSGSSAGDNVALYAEAKSFVLVHRWNMSKFKSKPTGEIKSIYNYLADRFKLRLCIYDVSSVEWFTYGFLWEKVGYLKRYASGAFSCRDRPADVEEDLWQCRYCTALLKGKSNDSSGRRHRLLYCIGLKKTRNACKRGPRLLFSSRNAKVRRLRRHQTVYDHLCEVGLRFSRSRFGDNLNLAFYGLSTPSSSWQLTSSNHLW